MFHQVVWIERAWRNLKMFYELESKPVLLHFKLPRSLVVKCKKNPKHRCCPMRDLLQFLPIYRQSDIKIGRRDPVIGAAVIRLPKRAVCRAVGPADGRKVRFAGRQSAGTQQHDSNYVTQRKHGTSIGEWATEPTDS